MKNYILISLFALSILGIGQTASCYELPENAAKELKEILSDKKFQPRGSNKSILRKELEKRIERFVENLQEIFSAGSEKIRNRESSDFWDIALQMLHDFSNWFLTALGHLVEATFYLSAFVLISLIIYKLFKLIRDKDPLEKSQVFLENSKKKHSASFDYRRLLNNGDLLEALVDFRKKLREQLDQQHRLNTSLTDREVLNKLGKENSLLNIFQRLALIFEKTAYAGTAPNQQAISKLVDDYEGTK